MSSYFDVLSWTRARKNREALEKTNPQNPVLNDDDEQFLERITSQEAAAPPLPTIEPTVIDDEGNETEANAVQKEAAGMILPSSPSEGKEKRSWASYMPSIPNVAVPSVPAIPSLASLRGSKADTKGQEKDGVESKDSETKAEGVVESEQTSSEKATEESTLDNARNSTEKIEETVEATKETLQETAETAKETIQETKEMPTDDMIVGSEPVTNQEVKDTAEDDKTKEEDLESKPEGKGKDQTTVDESEKPNEPTQRTWASYIPAMPNIPSIGRNAKGKEAEDITAKVQSPEAKEQDEREVSVLLDRLNLSAINNRVFSFSDQSQKIYGQFTLILKDIVNGAPTAYEDLETLLKENEKHLEQMFKNMPPFVQTLVKSLPSKFATSMGPEIMAMAGDKPGNDLKKRMETASQASSSASANIKNMNLDVKKKQKRRIPGVKDLASQKGTVTSMLTNIVNFLKVRFPAFVTGTNVVMSLAVFILLFVFWYCHKRGKEVRMLRESESSKTSANISEVSDSSSSDSEQETEKEKENQETAETRQETPSPPESDTEEQKVAAAKAYAAGMQKSAVGGPDNPAALRAKKILEKD